MSRRTEDILAHADELAERFEKYDPKPGDEVDEGELRNWTTDGRQATDSGYTDANGVPFTDTDIERWAALDRSEKGYTGGHLGPSRPSKPGNIDAV